MSIWSFCGKLGFLILRTSDTYDSNLEDKQTHTHTHTQRTEKEKGRTGHQVLGCVYLHITTMAWASLAVANSQTILSSHHCMKRPCLLHRVYDREQHHEDLPIHSVEHDVWTTQRPVHSRLDVTGRDRI